MLQGQEHLWLERVAHVVMRVQHTKCTITHTHVGIHTHNAITQSKKSKKTLPMFLGYGLIRYKKCKIDIVIPRECSPSKEQER